MTTKEIRAVLKLELYDHVATKAKASGMTNAKYIAQLVAQDMANRLRLSSSDTLKGIAVEKAILAGKPKWLDSDYWERKQAKKQALWLDGCLWLVSKSANGNQQVADKLMEYPEVLFDGSGGELFYLKDYVEAKTNWDSLKALDGIEYAGADTFEHGAYFFSCWSYDKRYDNFSKHEDRTIKAIAEAKAKLEATRTALEVANDEIAIEAITKASTPLNEVVVIDTKPTSDVVEQEQIETSLELSVELTVAEFRARFEFDDKTYGSATGAGQDGWVSPSGDRWFLEGSKKSRVWTRRPVAVAEPTDKVLSIV